MKQAIPFPAMLRTFRGVVFIAIVLFCAIVQFWVEPYINSFQPASRNAVFIFVSLLSVIVPAVAVRVATSAETTKEPSSRYFTVMTLLRIVVQSLMLPNVVVDGYYLYPGVTAVALQLILALAQGAVELSLYK